MTKRRTICNAPPKVVARHFGSACTRILLAGLFVLALIALGCEPQRYSEPSQDLSAELSASEQKQALFDYAMGLLEDLDQYNDFNNQQALNQIVGRLNQWIRLEQPSQDWQPDPIIQALPDAYQRLTIVERTPELKFADVDGTLLREAVWLRDASRVARGDAISEFDQGRVLFDWTVRNIQLDDPDAAEFESAQLPWHTLLFGHGTAADRAWLFVLLGRQQGLDVVMLAVRDAETATGYRPWAAALVTDDGLYLFDPELGLPIPRSDGQGVATLAEAATDEQVLRQLDLEERRYPITSQDAQNVIALIEASPAYLARRMQLVQANLAGDRSIVLSTDTAALSERIRKVSNVDEVRPWLLPYERIAAQGNMSVEQTRAMMAEALPFQVAGATLWKARVLHLMGNFGGEHGANALYLASRPANAEIASAELKPEEKEILERRKQAASYWLGLVAFERNKFDTAIQHFEKRTLEAWPNGRWTSGATYNLARALEASDATEEAVELYATDSSPQWHGNRLRAKQLTGGKMDESSADAERGANHE